MHGRRWMEVQHGLNWPLTPALPGRTLALSIDPLGYYYVFSGNDAYSWTVSGQKSNFSALNIQQWQGVVNGTLTIPAAYNPCSPYVNFVQSPTNTTSTAVCGVTGLPTASAGSGVSYFMSSAAFPNMSQWPSAAWGADNDINVAAFPQPVTLGGVLYPAGSWLWWGTQALVQASTNQGQSWAQLAYGSDYPASQGNAGCAHRNSFNRFYIMGDSLGANVSFAWASTTAHRARGTRSCPRPLRPHGLLVSCPSVHVWSTCRTMCTRSASRIPG